MTAATDEPVVDDERRAEECAAERRGDHMTARERDRLSDRRADAYERGLGL